MYHSKTVLKAIPCQRFTIKQQFGYIICIYSGWNDTKINVDDPSTSSFNA